MTCKRSRSRFACSIVPSCAGLPALTALTALVLLLAGCGRAGASGVGSTSATTHAPSAPTATASVATGASTPAAQPTAAGQKAAASAANGCLSAQAPANAASFTPNVIVGQPAQNNGASQPVTLARGQRLELRLPPMESWELSATGTSGILAGANPQGWYDSSARACIWRFTAQGAGNAQLTFIGAAVCSFLRLCPSVEETITYTVTVR